MVVEVFHKLGMAFVCMLSGFSEELSVWLRASNGKI
jgi:hypothetical protein